MIRFSFNILCTAIFLTLGCQSDSRVREKADRALLDIDSLQDYLIITPSRALALLDSVAHVYAKDDETLQNIYRRKGNIYVDLNLHEKGIDFYNRSILLSEKRKDTIATASTLANMGAVYSEMEMHDKAIKYFKNALDLYRKEKYYLGIADQYYNLAEKFAQKPDFDSAMMYANEAIHYKNLCKEEYKSDLPYFYVLKLKLLYNANKLDSGSQDIEVIQKIVKSSQKPYLLCLFNAINYKQCSGCLANSIRYYYQLSSAEEKLECAEYLGNIFQTLHKPDSVIHYQAEILKYKDSVNNARNFLALNKGDIVYQLISNRENKILKIENRDKMYGLVALALGFAGLGLILFLYRKNAKQQQKVAQQLIKEKNSEIVQLLQNQELETFDAAMKGQEEERTRIARELHDRLGSLLSIAKLNFSTLQQDIKQLEVKNQENYVQVNSILNEAMDEVRRISHDLYAGSVVNFGLVTALHQLANAVAAANKIQVVFQHHSVPITLGHTIQIELYRVVQELLQNSLKYASAKRIDIFLSGEDDKLRLNYEDDGNGFDTAADDYKHGLGYRNIEARMKKINGVWKAESAIGKGMLFWAEIDMTLLGANQNAEN